MSRGNDYVHNFKTNAIEVLLPIVTSQRAEFPKLLLLFVLTFFLLPFFYGEKREATLTETVGTSWQNQLSITWNL